jgi:hypothetical protein
MSASASPFIVLRLFTVRKHSVMSFLESSVSMIYLTSEGRAGNWIAGPRVRVRSGRSAKFPGRRCLSEDDSKMQRGGIATNQLLIGLIEED